MRDSLAAFLQASTALRAKVCTHAGWYWYCDVHETHGNADSWQEAELIAEAHLKYKSIAENIDVDECCDLHFTQAGGQ
jgi:hypothetical protein